MRVQYLRMYIRWFPETPTYSHLCTVSSSVYSAYLPRTWVHTAVGSEFSQLSSMESGLFWCRLAQTWDDSFSGLESLTLITLSCDQKLSPAGQQTAKHDGLYPLLSISLTVPPSVERFQQCDDPCRIGFYALAFLSFFSDSISESYVYTSFWLSNVASLAI